MSGREWHVTWRSIIVPLLAPTSEVRQHPAHYREKDELRWQHPADRKTKWEIG